MNKAGSSRSDCIWKYQERVLEWCLISSTSVPEMLTALCRRDFCLHYDLARQWILMWFKEIIYSDLFNYKAENPSKDSHLPQPLCCSAVRELVIWDYMSQLNSEICRKKWRLNPTDWDHRLTCSFLSTTRPSALRFTWADLICISLLPTE